MIYNHDELKRGNAEWRSFLRRKAKNEGGRLCDELKSATDELKNEPKDNTAMPLTASDLKRDKVWLLSQMST